MAVFQIIKKFFGYDVSLDRADTYAFYLTELYKNRGNISELPEKVRNNRITELKAKDLLWAIPPEYNARPDIDQLSNQLVTLVGEEERPYITRCVESFFKYNSMQCVDGFQHNVRKFEDEDWLVFRSTIVKYHPSTWTTPVTVLLYTGLLMGYPPVNDEDLPKNILMLWQHYHMQGEWEKAMTLASTPEFQEDFFRFIGILDAFYCPLSSTLTDDIKRILATLQESLARYTPSAKSTLLYGLTRYPELEKDIVALRARIAELEVAVTEVADTSTSPESVAASSNTIQELKAQQYEAAMLWSVKLSTTTGIARYFKRFPKIVRVYEDGYSRRTYVAAVQVYIQVLQLIPESLLLPHTDLIRGTIEESISSRQDKLRTLGALKDHAPGLYAKLWKTQSEEWVIQRGSTIEDPTTLGGLTAFAYGLLHGCMETVKDSVPEAWYVLYTLSQGIEKAKLLCFSEKPTIRESANFAMKEMMQRHAIDASLIDPRLNSALPLAIRNKEFKKHGYLPENLSDPHASVRLNAMRAFGFPESARADSSAVIRLEACRQHGYQPNHQRDTSSQIRMEALIQFENYNWMVNDKDPIIVTRGKVLTEEAERREDEARKAAEEAAKAAEAIKVEEVTNEEAPQAVSASGSE